MFVTMTTPILTKIVGLYTTVQIWNRLITYFVFHTRAEIKKLKVQLKNPKKDRIVNTFYYISRKRGCPIGALISIDEYIEIILDGLFKEYDITILTLNVVFDMNTRYPRCEWCVENLTSIKNKTKLQYISRSKLLINKHV